MPKLSTQDCPEQKTLSDFLLGKLDPKTLADCEHHLANCQPCVDTISGLDVGDTFQSLVVESANQQESFSASDESIVGNLIHRMTDVGSHSALIKTSIDQRAADVVGLLEPAKADGSIGQIEHYRIEEVIGCGSTGVVFRAVDENLHRPVAIKVLRPTLGDAARHRFIAEARATANLDHPNIVTIFQVGDTETMAFIVMQWLPGETLENRLERESILTPEEVVKVGSQIANGLSAAHEQGLVHRDIKPANLWITKTDQVKILDFGLVRIMDESPQLTCTGMIAGTPCYMSPEQSRGDELDLRSDLFSLGCVLYQCLTGKLPFASSNALATLQAIQRVQPEPPTNVDSATPTDLSDLVMGLLEKSPHRRPACALDVASALESDRSEWKFECDNYSNSNLETASRRIQQRKPRSRPQLQPSSLWKYIALTLTAGLVGWGAFMFGPQIIRIATDQGEIVINSNDPDVQIEVLSGGKSIEVVDLKTKQTIQIKSGSYQIRSVGDQNSVSIDKETLTLSRGESEIVTVTKSAFLPNVNIDSASEPTNELVSPLSNPIASNLKSSSSIDPLHRVGPGDVLNVYIEGLFGKGGADKLIAPAVHVRSDGKITLPEVEPIDVAGKTALEIENELRTQFIGPILKHGMISVNVNRVYEGNQSLSEPVYDGMTFAQCLNAVKFERDGEKLSKPVLGIVELKKAKENPDLFEPLLQAVLRIRKTDFHARAAVRFAAWITDEQLQELVLMFSSSDSHDEWAMLNQDLLPHWNRIRSIEEQFVSNALMTIKRDKVRNDLPSVTLINVMKSHGVSEESMQKSIDPLLNSIVHSENASYHFGTLIEIDRDMKGLGQAIAESIPMHKNLAGDEWHKVLRDLEGENRDVAIPAFTQMVLSTKFSQEAAIFLAILPDAAYKLVKSEIETSAKNGNDTAKAIVTYRDGSLR